MKIVHFAKFYPPEYGGIESVTQALAEDHAEAGQDVKVVCFTRDNSRMNKINNISFIKVKILAEISSQPLALSYLGACTRAAKNAEVVHVHTPNMLAALAVLRLPRHVRVVIHWHADIENKGTIGRLVRPIERAMLRRADIVVTTTKAYAEASHALAAFKDRIKVIPIGIADNDKAPKFEITTPPYVLFVGRLVPYKGLSILLDAIAAVQSDVELRIVGVGPLMNELQAQATSLDIADRVKFMDRVGEDQLQSLMERAAIFCLPSINRLEAFGVVLLEAMRAGRAIISTNISGSGVPWVNAMGLTVPAGDATALAEAIDRLLANPDETARLGELARSRFKRDFSRELMTNRFLSLYQNLLKNASNWPSTHEGNQERPNFD